MWTRSLLEKALECDREDRPYVTALVLDVKGSAPQRPGAAMLVLEDGSIVGTIGGGAIEHRAIREAQALMDGGDILTLDLDLVRDVGMACGGSMKLALMPSGRAEQVVIFGAGHCARALAPILNRIGFRITIADDREALLDPVVFPPDTRLVRGLLGDQGGASCVRAGDWVLVMTHGHDHDLDVLRAILPLRTTYIGCMASRSKAASFRSSLTSEGFDEAQLEGIRMPIGLDIAARGPEEIAVSIAAEMIELRRKNES